MCSCSGNCNCNSTTIPRGPQGPTGAAGIAATIAVGDVTTGTPAAVTNSGTSSAAIFDFTIPPGSSGAPGIDGINAFSPLTNSFIQPDFVTPVNIDAEPTAWMGIKQIVYISSNTLVGGFYQINSKTGTTVNVTRLDWTAPNVTFVSIGGTVPGNSFIIPSGTIGAVGPAGSSGSAILHYFWGDEVTGSNGLVIKHFNSTATPASYMNTNGDSLEIDAVFVIRFPIEVEDITLTFSIKINNSISDNPLTSFTTTIAEYGLGLISETTDLITLHAKCKIQRIGSRGIASKTEWLISNINDNPVGTPYTGFIKTTNSNVISNSITTVTLPGYEALPLTNNWNSPQYILLCVEGDGNEPPDNIVYVRHCEIKSFKKI
jgi:hypothetical protein